MSDTMRVEILPVAKPRMTRRDKWERRPCVLRYRTFRDKMILGLQRTGFEPGHAMELIFHIPMPTSWSKKKRAAMIGQPHQQKPDVDNLTKSVLDSFFDDDSLVYEIRAKKIWAELPAVVIKNLSGGNG